RELAEMVRFAVGYRSRVFVTFGRPISIDGFDPSSRSSLLNAAHLARPAVRRSVLDLAQLVRRAMGRLYKVLPTALVAAAMRPSITRKELVSRIDSMLDTLRATGANLAVTSGREA